MSDLPDARRVEHRVAVVTGGAGGIGSAICAALVRDGYAVVSLDRDVGVDAAVEYLVVDLSDDEAVEAAAADLVSRRGPVSSLVHCAADFRSTALANLDLDVWRAVQRVNVESFLVLARGVAPSMPDDGTARIIVIVSDTVLAPPSRHMLTYAASKAALVGIVRVLARDLAERRIAVAAVAPGLVATPAAVAGLPSEAFAAVLARQSLDRTLVPDDIAHAVAFLAGPGGAAMTGQTLVVNGGVITP